MADIQVRLDSDAIAHFPLWSAFRTNFDDDAGTFVTWAAYAGCAHRWDIPVVQHVVDVRHTQPGGVESDKQLIVLCRGVREARDDECRTY